MEKKWGQGAHADGSPASGWYSSRVGGFLESQQHSIMLIEFRCPNNSEFDAAKGRFVECGEVIVTSDDNVGQTVVCPRCGAEVEVPFEVLQKTRAGDSPSETQSRSGKRRPRPNRSGSSRATRIAQQAETSGTRSTASSARSGDIMDREIQTTTRIESGGQSRPRCPECGALLSDDGRCSLCHYVAPEFRAKGVSIEDGAGGLAGFQLWLSEMMTGSLSLRAMAWIVAVLFSIATLLIAAVLILLGTSGTYIAAGVLVGIYAFCMAWLIKAHQMSVNPRARLAFWQRPFWNAVLWFARALNWEKYDSRLVGRVVIDLRNAPISDDRIPEIEGLKKCQVLDLENTMITDRGLLYLYGLPHLQCLVVRKTKVGPEAVARLQQANRRLWIWD